MKNKKMVLWIALVVMAIIPVYAQQNGSEQYGSGQWGGSNRSVNIYEIEDDKNIKDGVSIIKYNGSEKEINIPESIQNKPVTKIGVEVFCKKNLTSVIIPNSVTYIERKAFDFNQLTSITIPDSVIEIDNRAFSENKLTSISIGNSVKYIGFQSFANNKLTNVTIPNSVIEIGREAFANNQLKSITFPNVINIETEAFANNQLTSVTIPNSIKTIGQKAFADNPLTSVTIPDSIGTFNNNVFSGARNLTRISIGANVKITGNEEIAYNFESYYLVNKRQAGIYTFSNGKWNFKPR